MRIQLPVICTLSLFSVAVLVTSARGTVIITPVFPTSQGQPFNLDSQPGGFVKIGSDVNHPDNQVNTTGGIISAITHVEGAFPFTSTQETANGVNYFQLQSAAHSINDNFGANTSFGNQNNTGNGFTFTVQNLAVPETLNVFVGQFAAMSTLTVTPTIGTGATISESSGANLYLDLVVSLPANSGPTTISWVETQSNGGANNPSIFAVTSSAPEPAACLMMGLGACGLLAVARRRRQA